MSSDQELVNHLNTSDFIVMSGFSVEYDKFVRYIYTGCFRTLVWYVYRVNDTKQTLHFNYNLPFSNPNKSGKLFSRLSIAEIIQFNYSIN